MPRQFFQKHDPSDRTGSGRKEQIRPDLYPVPEPATEPRTRDGCPRCGAVIEPDAQFCVSCGLNIASPTHGSPEWLKARPWLLPRLCAEILDRLFPFAMAPVIAVPMLLIGWNGFFWTWLSVAFLWHLLRDCSANRRSLGKRWFRLRVVSATSQKRSAWPQAVGRRIFSALSQCAYCVAIAAFLVRLQPLSEIPWPWPLFIYALREYPLAACIRIRRRVAHLHFDQRRRPQDRGFHCPHPRGTRSRLYAWPKEMRQLRHIDLDGRNILWAMW